MKPIIEVKNISKKYQIREKQSYYSLRDTIAHIVKNPFKAFSSNKENFWALKDVSFDVMPGEIIGIIGKNGAGKSTLLKVLSQITPPTKGEIHLRGRVASLLEVGTGFHPELTGRENIFLNGSILGMTRKEIRQKFDQIVEFSEISQFLDTPVKHYSSGMYMRLAFSVAAHLDSEILIVDEVLAVGDQQFRNKCLKKMDEVKNGGRTVLFVSHDMSSIRNICSKVIIMSEGKILKSGKTTEMMNFYEKSMVFHSSNTGASNTRANDSEKFKLIKVELQDKSNKPSAIFNAGDSMKIHLTSNKKAEASNYTIEFQLLNERGNIISFGTANPITNTYFSKADDHYLCELGPLLLTTGKYSFNFGAKIWGGERWDFWEDAINFEIVHCDLYKTGYDITGDVNGDFVIEQKWSTK